MTRSWTYWHGYSKGLPEPDARVKNPSLPGGAFEGVIYVQHDRMRGVLLWTVWEQVVVARRLIAESGPFTPKNLKGRLPVNTSSPKQDS